MPDMPRSGPVSQCRMAAGWLPLCDIYTTACCLGQPLQLFLMLCRSTVGLCQHLITCVLLHTCTTAEPSGRATRCATPAGLSMFWICACLVAYSRPQPLEPGAYHTLKLLSSYTTLSASTWRRKSHLCLCLPRMLSRASSLSSTCLQAGSSVVASTARKAGRQGPHTRAQVSGEHAMSAYCKDDLNTTHWLQNKHMHVINTRT